jgi:hypothetical protein
LPGLPFLDFEIRPPELPPARFQPIPEMLLPETLAFLAGELSKTIIH